MEFFFFFETIKQDQIRINILKPHLNAFKAGSQCNVWTHCYLFLYRAVEYLLTGIPSSASQAGPAEPQVDCIL